MVRSIVITGATVPYNQGENPLTKLVEHSNKGSFPDSQLRTSELIKSKNSSRVGRVLKVILHKSDAYRREAPGLHADFCDWGKPA